MPQLKIELISDLCRGSGLGYAGVVDRDVVFDDLGLPRLPGRALNGVLRDAYVDVERYRTGYPPLEKLFGKPGQSGNGSVSISNGLLADYERLREWLLAARHGRRSIAARDEVLAAFTVFRRQTAMDRSTGSPLKDTLRLTRALVSGLIFIADVGLSDPADKPAVEAAAKAAKLMGLSRSRGLGRVRCTLAPSQDASTMSGKPDAGGDLLRFRIRLRAEAIFPDQVSDPNTVVSRDYVPGSAVLGVVASLWDDKSTVPESLLRGDIHFLNAYPVIGGRRSVPLPHSIRQSKSDENVFYDLISEEWPDEPFRRVRGWCEGTVPSLGTGKTATVLKRFNYHHQRSDDRRIGRAIGSEREAGNAYGTASDGAFFAYESIAEGQEFESAIIGPADVLRKIATRLEAVPADRIRLGRSKRAEYGGSPKWTWLQSDTGREMDGWRSGAPDVEVQQGDKIIVRLLSPVCWFNDCGHPAPEFPWKELAGQLGADCSLTVVKSFARTRIHGGFLAHQGLPRQQFPCLAAGSVFLVQASREVDRAALRAAEKLSYGVRQEEGMGRCALDFYPQTSRPMLQQEPEVQAGQGVTLRAGDPATWLARRLFYRAVERTARRDGTNLAYSDASASAGVSPSQIARLMQVLQDNSLSDAKVRLDNYKEKAKKSLGCVYDQVLTVLADPHHFFALAYNKTQDNAASQWKKVFGPIGPACTAEEQNAIIRLGLMAYLRTLKLLNRSAR